MKEVNMKPEEIANLVVLSREKGYAIIIPQDALYLVSKAFQKLISQRDAQIAALDEAVRVQVENVVQANSLISQLRQSECDLEEQVENNEAQIAALKADFISLDKQMSVLEQTGIADRDRAQKAEAQIAALTAENVALKDFTLKARDAVENWNSWADEEDKILNEPETPATDAAANALRAAGVESFSKWLRDWADIFDQIGKHEWADKNRVAADKAKEFAKQLREGK